MYKRQDINKIALDLREAHKDDFFSVPEDNPLEDFLHTADETARDVYKRQVPYRRKNVDYAWKCVGNRKFRLDIIV